MRKVAQGMLDGDGEQAGRRYLQAVEDLAPALDAAGEWGDRERRLPDDLARAMAVSGLFAMALPRSIGGGEVPFPAYLEVVEAVARHDGSAGWCLVQGSLSASQVAPYFPHEVAQEIFGSPHMILANGTGQSGKAVRVDGGYRLTGRWSFASGCMHATWLKAAAPVVASDGTPERREDGSRVSRSFLFPAGQATLIDTWHVSGLRGTGSNTIEVTDMFVPERHTVWAAASPLVEKGVLFAMPSSSLACSGFAGVAMGIARGALDALAALAVVKRPRNGDWLLAEDATIQAGYASAEARLRGARSFLFDAISELWWETEAGHPTRRQRALVRLAATHGIHQAASAVDFAYQAAGATAIFATNPFERRFRDVHAVTQQGQASPCHLQTVGRVLLGVDLPSDAF